MKSSANNLGVVIPAKNEEKSLHLSLNSILNQTLKPMTIVVVDDHSTDRTPIILNEYKKKHCNIQSVRLPPHKWDLGIHYSEVCIKGFDHLLRKVPKTEFIALIDADMILEKTYFEKLISELKKYPKLGIVGGGIYIKNKKGRWKLEKTYLDHVRGANRVWRRECFDSTGGFIKGYAPDSISNAKAKMRDWELKQFPTIKSYQTRKTSSGQGLWKGYINLGKTSYYLGYHPIHVLFRFFKYSTKWPIYPALGYAKGWITSILRKENRIQDNEVRKYFKQKLIARIRK